VSETLTVHEYESKTLAKAFEEITASRSSMKSFRKARGREDSDLMQFRQVIYDGWINDSDFIGTHYRYGKILNLTDTCRCR